MAGAQQKRRWKRALAALAVGLVLGDLALSAWIAGDGLLLGHPLPPFGAITHPRQRAWIRQLVEEPRGTGTFDAELGWSVRPDAVSADGRAHTNAIGARGRRDYALAKPAGTTRLVCVGDSFVWGDEVADEDTFGAQLENMRPAVECINLGVAAYGTDQALLRWRRDGAALQPDLLVVGLLLENIGRNVNRYRPLWYPASASAPAKPRFTLENDRLELLPQPFASGAELARAIEDGSVLERLAEHEHWSSPRGPWRVSSLARCLAAVASDRARDVERLWRAPAEEPFRVTLALLKAFAARRVVVLVFPREVDLTAALEDEPPCWTALLDALEQAGIPYLDLGPDLARLVADHRRDPARPHPYSGGHLSRSGNALVARALSDFLE